jgi:NAD(P)-dependent dehydrogenase (short-subunit alcohol dehydrogenase family)
VELQDRRIILTGATGGLGLSLAAALLAAGARVAAVGRHLERLRALDGRGATEAGRLLPIPADLRQPEAAERVVEAVLAAWGGVDGLVNNAGRAWGEPLERISLARVEEDLSLNLVAPLLLSRACALAMRAGGGGSIVQVASVLGLRPARPDLLTAPAYQVAKAALLQLTRVAAVEWAAWGVRVNAVAPGFFPTRMTRSLVEGERGERLKRAIPMGRWGRPEDLTGVVVLLLSDRAGYITGTCLEVDGGLSCVLG